MINVKQASGPLGPSLLAPGTKKGLSLLDHSGCSVETRPPLTEPPTHRSRANTHDLASGTTARLPQAPGGTCMHAYELEEVVVTRSALPDNGLEALRPWGLVEPFPSFFE